MEAIQIKEKLLSFDQFEDNNYLDLYCNIIKANNSTTKEKYKTQKHHIIPRCYFKYNSLDIDNSENNLVNLLYKDHILAHYYLCLCCCDSILSYKLFAGLSHLIYNKNVKLDDLASEINLNLDKYQELYETYIKNMSLDKERGHKISSKLIGSKRTPEQSMHISLSRVGKPIHNTDSRANISKHMKGKNKSPKSDYLKQQVSKANQGNTYRTGKPTPPEAKKLIGSKNKGKGSSPIICIETQIQYNSIIEASNTLNINPTAISNACRGIIQIKAGGYHWAYLNDISRQDELKEYIGKPPTKSRDISSKLKASISSKARYAKSPKDNSYLMKPILCIETNQIFPSLAEAKSWLGKGDIGSYMMGKQSYAGKLEDGTKLHWRYLND